MGIYGSKTDVLDRMDKFYLLIRRFVNATFRLLSRPGWKGEAVEAVNQLYSVKGGPMT